jgi:hypothetical protein
LATSVEAEPSSAEPDPSPVELVETTNAEPSIADLVEATSVGPGASQSDRVGERGESA